MRTGASTPSVRFSKKSSSSSTTSEQRPNRSSTPGPTSASAAASSSSSSSSSSAGSAFLTGVEVSSQAQQALAQSPQPRSQQQQQQQQTKKGSGHVIITSKDPTFDTSSNKSGTSSNNSNRMMTSGFRSKMALAQQNREESAGLVKGVKTLTRSTQAGRRVFVRCADDTSIQPWPLNPAIANVAAITGDMDLMQRHGLLDPTTELHPLFSLEQMKRLYYAKCADAKRPTTDERLARFCETLGNFACGQQFVMRECKFESHSIRTICGIFGEGGPPATLAHLDLSGNNLGVAGGRLIAAALPKLEELCVLRLGSANLGEGIGAIASALRDNQSVTHFDLSATHCGAHRNAIIGDTTRILCTMLRRNRVLAHINLSNTSLKTSGPVLLESMALCRSLVHIALRDNGLDHECAEPLAKMVTQLRWLETLDLAENHFTGASIELLCRALCARKIERGSRTVLQCLDVSSNRIDAAVDSAVDALCMVIEGLGIRRLVLSDNNLCRAGFDPLEGLRLPPTTRLVAKIFNSASKPSSGVEWLELANCGFHDVPDTALACMCSPATLKRLDLSRNNLKDIGCESLAHGIANPDSVLELLDISNNNCTTAGARVIAKALRTNKSLRHLKCYNGARFDEEKSGLVDAIAAHKKLERVDLQQAFLHDVKESLERNRQQRSRDSVWQAEQCREKIAEIVSETNDTKEQVREERHRLEHQLDVLKIMRERAKTTSSNQTATLNQLTNETIEWRSRYEEMQTQYNAQHEEIMTKQNKLIRVLDEATRASDREQAEKNSLLTDAWLTHTDFTMLGYTKCNVEPPSLGIPPGGLRGRIEVLKSQDMPEDEEVVLENKLKKLLGNINDSKDMCDIYHRKLLALGVHEDDIESVVPKDKLLESQQQQHQQGAGGDGIVLSTAAATAAAGGGGGMQQQQQRPEDPSTISQSGASEQSRGGGSRNNAPTATTAGKSTTKPKPKPKKGKTKPVRPGGKRA